MHRPKAQQAFCKNLAGAYCKNDLSDTIPNLVLDSLSGNKSLVYGKTAKRRYITKMSCTQTIPTGPAIHSIR